MRHRTTDVYFVGFPRSGNTWLRFLVGRYMQLLCSSEDMLLFGRYDLFGRCEKACIGPAMNFNHGKLQWDNHHAEDLSYEEFVQPFMGKKIILLSRYPLDVMVSNWAYDVNIAKTYEGDLPAYLDDPIRGLGRLFRFHNLWASARDEFPGLMLSRYEDMRDNTALHFRKIVEFLELPLKLEIIGEAIEYASFSNMKNMQFNKSEENIKVDKAKLFRTGDPGNAEAHHVRRGKVGGYRDYLTDSVSTKLEASIENEMVDWFGYSHPFHS
ncbi:MAG: hypothetical protein HND51_02185 [Chloroflexi bacterium]|nr:hypothetical protein [Chloroflexota bacterium]